MSEYSTNEQHREPILRRTSRIGAALTMLFVAACEGNQNATQDPTSSNGSVGYAAFYGAAEGEEPATTEGDSGGWNSIPRDDPGTQTTPETPPWTDLPSSAQGTSCLASTIEVGGSKRLYVVCTPNQPPTAPLPVVLVFHGGGGRAAATMERHAWHVSDSVDPARGWPEGDRIVSVYLQGCMRRDGLTCCKLDAQGRCTMENDDGQYSWNVAGAGVLSVERAIWSSEHDVAYVKAVLAELRQVHHLPIAPRRVYASGHSKGAMMTYRLACDPEISRKIAGILSVSGTLILPSCFRHDATTVLQVTGVDDPSTPCPNGGSPYSCYEGDPSVAWQGCARAAIEEPLFGQGIWSSYDYANQGLSLFDGGCEKLQWPPVKVGLDHVAGPYCIPYDVPLNAAGECQRPGVSCERKLWCWPGFNTEWARVTGATHNYDEIMSRFDVRRFAWERWAVDRIEWERNHSYGSGALSDDEL